MKSTKYTTFLMLAAALLYLSAPGSISRADDPAQHDVNAESQVKAQAHQDLENQRQQAEQEATKSLDQDAVNAISETENAVKAIDAGKNDDALAALEQATGKITLLVGRNPATALIPVAVDAEMIDAAPDDLDDIKAISKAAERAMGDKDYPAARALLMGLVSEIRVRTYNLPLASYPTAMTDAARLLDEKEPGEARVVLQTALDTLAVIDRITPLPVAISQEAINQAQAERDKDKDAAKRLLAVASYELERSKALGYAGDDPEYAALSSAVSDIESQINGNNDTGSAFARLKDKIASFFKRQSSSQKSSEVARAD